MKKRTLRTALAAIAGALSGAVVVFLVLAALGSRAPVEPTRPSAASALPSVAATPSPVPPSPSKVATTPSPVHTTSPAAGVVTSEQGGFQLRLPAGYRVAQQITDLDRSQIPEAGTLTITKGSAAEEAQYVQVIEQLRRDQTATEAPVFLPGKTLTVFRVRNASAEAGDAQLARSKIAVTTKAGYSGIRYRRVEGLFTYDMTYLKLPGDVPIAIQMSYASEEPLFDEGAYQAVLDSLQSLFP